MLSVFVAAIAALIPITNPIGAVAAYAGLSAHLDADERRRQAWRTGIYVAVILAAFAVLGTLILQLFGISLAALQIAGALVVMHSGFGIVVPRDAPPATAPDAVHAATKTDISFSPMALPLIAGPGAIGVVIGIAARNTGVLDRVAIVAAVVVIAAVIAVLLRYGTPLVLRLGPARVDGITRVMGFLILAIGVELLVHGLAAAFPALA
ncbi:MarC family protein [Microbacterium lacticum]